MRQRLKSSRLTRRAAVAALLGVGALAAMRPASAQAPAVNSGDTATLDEARRLHESGAAVLIDLREPDEHATGVAAGARLLPLSQLGRRAGEIARDRPVLLICNTQNRSRKVAEALRERGYTQVRYVVGGMSTWAAKGWPLVPPGPKK